MTRTSSRKAAAPAVDLHKEPKSDIEIARDRKPVSGLRGFTRQPQEPAGQTLGPEGGLPSPAHQRNSRPRREGS